MSRLAGLLQLSNGHEDSPAGKQVEVGLHISTSALLPSEYVPKLTYLVSAKNKGLFASAGKAIVTITPFMSASLVM